MDCPPLLKQRHCWWRKAFADIAIYTCDAEGPVVPRKSSSKRADDGERCDVIEKGFFRPIFLPPSFCVLPATWRWRHAEEGQKGWFVRLLGPVPFAVTSVAPCARWWAITCGYVARASSLSTLFTCAPFGYYFWPGSFEKPRARVAHSSRCHSQRRAVIAVIIGNNNNSIVAQRVPGRCGGGAVVRRGKCRIARPPPRVYYHRANGQRQIYTNKKKKKRKTYYHGAMFAAPFCALLLLLFLPGERSFFSVPHLLDTRVIRRYNYIISLFLSLPPSFPLSPVIVLFPPSFCFTASLFSSPSYTICYIIITINFSVGGLTMIYDTDSPPPPVHYYILCVQRAHEQTITIIIVTMLQVARSLYGYYGYYHFFRCYKTVLCRSKTVVAEQRGVTTYLHTVHATVDLYS